MIRLWKYAFIRFLLIGCVNTIFGILAYWLFLFIGCHYVLASGGATILGILFNYHTIRSLVFYSNVKGRIPRFFGVYALGFCLNAAVLSIFDYFAINLYLAGTLTTAFLVIPLFIAHKYFVFGTFPTFQTFVPQKKTNVQMQRQNATNPHSNGAINDQ